MAGQSGNPRARFLGAEIRAAREEAGKGLRELAKELGFGHAKLSLWERGMKVPTTEDVASILALLNITGEERERLLELARTAEDSEWLAVGIPGISEQLSALMEFERTATEIIHCSPLLVPGLLQTGDYARGIMGNDRLADNRVAMRLGRVDILTRRNPVRLTAFVSRSVLTYSIGGPEVMVDQLRHLLTMGDRPNVDVRVMRSDVGYHPGLLGPFLLLKFATTRPIVHLEHRRASAFVYDENDVVAFVEAAEAVAEIAMSSAESAELIADVIQDTETR